MEIKSPLTFSTEVSLDKVIPSRKIIDLYKNDYNIDVSRFFIGVKDVYIYKCDQTLYRFYYPFMLSGDGKFYEELQRLPGYYPQRKWEHSKVEEFISDNDRVLEIGCAEGSFLEGLKNKTALCIGLELNEKAVQIGNEKGILILNESIQKHSILNKEKYDVVCSFQVMEHINTIHEVIQASIDVLKVGGSLFIAVPNNDSFINFDEEHTLNYPPHHMGLWNKKSLQSLETIFPVKCDGIFYEQPLNNHKHLYNKIVNKLVSAHRNERINRYGKLGSLINLLSKPYEKVRLRKLYPTLGNFTIIAKYSKVY